MTKLRNLQEIINECKELSFDLNFTRAKKWKDAQAGRVIVGYMPIYFPREIIHAAGGLPVAIFGGGDRKQIIKGDWVQNPTGKFNIYNTTHDIY